MAPEGMDPQTKGAMITRKTSDHSAALVELAKGHAPPMKVTSNNPHHQRFNIQQLLSPYLLPTINFIITFFA
jgi:hypothetical protein